VDPAVHLDWVVSATALATSGAKEKQPAQLRRRVVRILAMAGELYFSAGAALGLPLVVAG